MVMSFLCRGCKVFFLDVASAAVHRPPQNVEDPASVEGQLLDGCQTAACTASEISVQVRRYRRTALGLSVLSHGGMVQEHLRREVTHIVVMGNSTAIRLSPSAHHSASGFPEAEAASGIPPRDLIDAGAVVKALSLAAEEAAAEAPRDAAPCPGRQSGLPSAVAPSQRASALMRSIRRRLVSASLHLGGSTAATLRHVTAGGQVPDRSVIHLVDPRCRWWTAPLSLLMMMV